MGTVERWWVKWSAPFSMLSCLLQRAHSEDFEAGLWIAQFWHLKTVCYCPLLLWNLADVKNRCHGACYFSLGQKSDWTQVSSWFFSRPGHPLYCQISLQGPAADKKVAKRGKKGVPISRAALLTAYTRSIFRLGALDAEASPEWDQKWIHFPSGFFRLLWLIRWKTTTPATPQSAFASHNKQIWKRGLWFEKDWWGLLKDGG